MASNTVEHVAHRRPDDIDRFNAALLTVAPGAPATARVDFYDRSGTVIQSITFDAS